MQNVIDTLACVCDFICVTKIALNELHAIENVGEVLPAPCLEIVEAADDFSALYKRLAKPGPKESGAAGH
jgi:hypothetical protein